MEMYSRVTWKLVADPKLIRGAQFRSTVLEHCLSN